MRPKLKLWLTVFLWIGLAAGTGTPRLGADEPAAARRPALQPMAFQPLALGQVKPSGWLREQLKTQAAGLSGHLDEFWPDIKHSAWIGGKAEGWERVPYWLDGVVPLAYLLDDRALQARIKPFIDSILEHQHPDGWLGPVGDSAGHQAYDVWPLFPLFKALTQYQEATGDPRVVPALLKCTRKIDQVIDRKPVYSWAKMRVADLAVSMVWLHGNTGETLPLEVARKAFTQSHDWRAQFDNFQFTGKTQGKFELDSHGVNTGMALKYGGMRYLLTGDARDKNAVFSMLDLLDRYHGQPTGIFSCDEHLAGRNPSQGTELCTVVEAMYSLELMAAVSGDVRLGDRLEQLAYNALPATFKKDMTAHQYDQQCNQVLCSRQGEHIYADNGPDSNLYGLEPNFGCCTANLHQGWPKFTESLWMKSSDGGLAVIAYAPCLVATEIKGKPVKIEVKTDYPFRDTIQITVTVSEAMKFPIHLRVPAWAGEVEIRAAGVAYGLGEGMLATGSPVVMKEKPPGEYLDFPSTWTGTKTISLRLSMPVRLYHGYNDAVAVERGPLVYALNIGTEWKKVKDNPQFADWEVYPTTPWNYALQIDRAKPSLFLNFEERPIGSPPFSSNSFPMIARVKGRRLAGWKIEKGAAAPPPPSPVQSTEPLEELTLVPYGCTDLRITEFPTLAVALTIDDERACHVIGPRASSWTATTTQASIPTPRDQAWLPGGSIVLKLTLFVGVLVALTAGTLTMVGFHYTGNMLRDQIDNRLTAMADDRRALLMVGLLHLEEEIRILTSRYRLFEVLDRLAGAAASGDRSQGNSERILDSVREDTAGLLALWVEDQAGGTLVSSGPRALLDLFQAEARSTRVATRDPALIGFPRRADKTYAALFRTTARSRSHKVMGQLMLVIDVGPILYEPSDPRRLGDTGEVLVGVPDHETTHYLIPPRLTPSEIDFPASRTPAMNRAVAGERGFMRTRDRLGREVLAAFRPVGYEDWGLVAKMDVDEAYAPVNELRLLMLAIGGLILTVGLAASYLIARQNTLPIRKLAATADAITRGQLDTRIDVNSRDEIGILGLAFSRMTGQIARSHADLEQRIVERTRDQEAMRDLLDEFFRIFTSRLDPQNIERTFDSVLRFCHQLGYDLAMISLVDREAGVIRGVRGAGSMEGVVASTVRPLQDDDILAVVVREGRSIIIGDSSTDPRCDQSAVARAQIRGQIVVPLIGDHVLGTLQVATPEILVPQRVDLRPLESLASHTARALDGLNQVEEIRRLNRSLEQQAVELVKSEAALREQTRILQLVLDCMREGVVVADREARLLVFNPAAERILGRNSKPGESDRWDPLHKVYRPDRVTPCPTEDLPLFRAIRGESVDHAELYIDYPSLQDGSWMLANARPLRDDQGEIQGGMVVFHDVTPRKNNERRLAVQYAATRVLSEVDSLTEAIPLILEIVGQRLDWDFGSFWRLEHGGHNLRCVTLWHGPDIELPSFEETSRRIVFAPDSGLPGRVWSTRKGAWLDELSQEASSPRYAAAAADGLKSGFAIPILVRGECLGVLEFFSRASRLSDQGLLEMMTNLGSQIGQFIDRHQMHARVIQSEKLASLGMLSAGVAHEINNPLAYIANNLAVLERDIGSLLTFVATYEKANDLLASTRPELLAEIERQNEECDFAYIRENLDKILRSTRQGVKRVAEIVHNLRGFARLDRAEVDQIDIHEALNSALEMIRGRLHRRHISVDQQKGELPLVSASPVQINQVFLNLLVNAMQAIEATHKDDGQIVIRTYCNTKDVTIEVLDNGCGIPPEVLPQIFDPFFTTKSVGDGTGLGLSITHGIVQDHAGRMEVESTLGRGTCFRVILPVSRR